jgi:diguanylate cyclase (GGDEF)-like protein/PAS domain S-box-containing protein
MNQWIRQYIARGSRVLVVACVGYSLVCVVALLAGWGGESVADYISAWGSFPLSFAILAMLWPSLRDIALTRRRRLAWRLIFAALVLDVVASTGWGYSALTENVTFGSWPDALYLFYYPLAAAACVLFYVDLGGRFTTTRALIDFSTIVIGIGSLLWFTALAPLATMSAAQLAENWSVVGYGLGNAVALIAGAMLAMQITDWRAERALVWLLAAMVTTLVADLLWVNAELRQDYEIGAPIDAVYFGFYLCLVIAGRCQLLDRQRASATLGLAGDLRGSLPIVALMVGTIALLDAKLGLASGQSPLLIIVLVGAGLLVMAGQAFATREMVALHREVATRRFDERLTELVRRSSDMIAICDDMGVIRYASPSSEALLGVQPNELAGQRLESVLGEEGPHVRAVFEEVLRAAHSEQVTQFSIAQADGEKRSYKMVIANLCHVDSIRGVTLNIRDISDATRLNDQLRTLAFHDPLTLLANRSLFSDRVHQALRHVADGMTPAVLFIDLDNFKTVNDSMGHGAGDALLRSFAHRLVQCTRAGDTVARLGGDEFAVLLDHVPGIDGALAVAKQAKGVEVKSGGYQTHPVTDEKGKITRWGASQDLILESADVDALSALIGKLQAKQLALRSITFSVSPETRRKNEDAMIGDALNAFQERAKKISAALAARDFEIVSLSIQSGGGGPVPMYARAEMAMDKFSPAPPRFESGQSTLTTRVDATIEIDK